MGVRRTPLAPYGRSASDARVNLALVEVSRVGYGGTSVRCPPESNTPKVVRKPVRVSARIETCLAVTTADSAGVCPA